MGPQGSAEPFLKAGPDGTVRPPVSKRTDSDHHEGFSARAFSFNGGAIKTLSRESVLTTNLIMMMIDHQENFERDDSQDRSAKRRGSVAHTTRPGKPESVEGEVNPIESRSHEECGKLLSS